MAADLVQLEARIEALADFVTTVVAALVADGTLPTSVLEAIMEDTPRPTVPGTVPGAVIEHDVAALAAATLAVAGRIPLPSPVRLVHSSEDIRGDDNA